MNGDSAAAPAAMSSRLSEWLPVVLWGAVMFTLSTSAFSAANTSRIIDPILVWIMPGISPTSLDVAHALIRKCAHFTEYGVLYWLLVHGPLIGRPYMALVICVAWAFLDEGHQMFVPGRTASFYDVALDSTGAVFSGFLTAAVNEIR
ncbi:MAG: VanZ family protein [Candidatus Binataceae bacterium]|jgi:VanZ family protein